MFKLRILWSYLLTRYLRRFRDRSALERFQRRKMKIHGEWVRKHSRFYRSWGDRPIDKKIMMEHFTDLNTVGVDRDEAFALALRAEETRDFTPTLNRVTVGLSSGTSGNRGLFLVSDQERARHAGIMLAKILPGSIFGRYRVAFFMRANSNLYTASSGSRILFEFFDLLTPVEQHLERLAHHQPDLLFAPPSLLIRLAEAQRSGRLKIRPGRIFSIAETLDPLDERRISDAFGMRVHQIYQCTEGFLGASCAEGTLHLNEDCVRIEPEWLDGDRTKFIPVVTDFTRTSQPIIRYRLNDILTPRKTPCPCGSPLLAVEAIEGRSDDVVQLLPEGSRSSSDRIPVFPDFIRRAVISAHPGIEEYLVIQKSPGCLEVHLKSEVSIEEDIRSRILQELRVLSEKVGARMPTVEFFRGIPSLGGKKLRRVLCLQSETAGVGVP